MIPRITGRTRCLHSAGCLLIPHRHPCDVHRTVTITLQGWKQGSERLRALPAVTRLARIPSGLDFQSLTHSALTADKPPQLHAKGLDQNTPRPLEATWSSRALGTLHQPTEPASSPRPRARSWGVSPTLPVGRSPSSSSSCPSCPRLFSGIGIRIRTARGVGGGYLTPLFSCSGPT